MYIERIKQYANYLVAHPKMDPFDENGELNGLFDKAFPEFFKKKDGEIIYKPFPATSSLQNSICHFFDIYQTDFEKLKRVVYSNNPNYNEDCSREEIKNHFYGFADNYQCPVYIGDNFRKSTFYEDMDIRDSWKRKFPKKYFYAFEKKHYTVINIGLNLELKYHENWDYLEKVIIFSAGSDICCSSANKFLQLYTKC